MQAKEILKLFSIKATPVTDFNFEPNYDSEDRLLGSVKFTLGGTRSIGFTGWDKLAELDARPSSLGAFLKEFNTRLSENLKPMLEEMHCELRPGTERTGAEIFREITNHGWTGLNVAADESKQHPVAYSSDAYLRNEETMKSMHKGSFIPNHGNGSNLWSRRHDEALRAFPGQLQKALDAAITKTAEQMGEVDLNKTSFATRAVTGTGLTAAR